MITETKILLAGEIRPEHVVSLTGYEKDAAVVIEVQPKDGYAHVEVILETGASRTLPIDFPMTAYFE